MPWLPLILSVFLVFAIIFIVLCASKNRMLLDQVNDLESHDTTKQAEIDRLRVQQARKVDRALWLLVSPKKKTVNQEFDILEIKMSPDLMNALDHGGIEDQADLALMIGEHVVRRVGKKAATA